MKIQTTQLAELSQLGKQRFVQQCVQHLRTVHYEQCAGRDHAGLQAYVEAMLVFAAKHRISQQECVLRLLDLQVTLQYPSHLPRYQHYRLTQREFDEPTRVHNFEVALRAGRNPILVSLDSDLRALEVAHG